MHSRFLLMLLLLTASTVFAETYRWVNEDGVVTYSETPPPDAQSEVVKTYSKPSSDAGTSKQRLQKLRQDLADREEDRNLRKSGQQEKEKESKIKKENCKIAKNNLQTLIALGNRLYKVGDDYLRLTEAQKQEKINQAKQQIKEYCN